MNLFANLRERFHGRDNYYQYAAAHVWSGGAAGVTLVGPSLMPLVDLAPGVRNFKAIRFAPATEYQPTETVLNGMGRFNQAQIVADSLLRNDDPALDGVLPYF